VADLLLVLVVALIALVVIGLVYQAVGSARDRRRFPPPGRLVDVGGHRLHVRIAGEGGPAVILESGIAASSINWSRIQPLVARFTRVLSYDRAGYAWSDKAPGPRTAGQAACELHTLLGAAAVPPPWILVGHSFGGLVIRAFFSRWPDDVAGLVFVDPTFPEMWLDMPATRRRLVAGGVLFSRIGGVLARVGVVRACLALLTRGRTRVPRTLARGFGPAAMAVLTRILGEVQKMPAEMHPAIQAHWSRPRSFASMASHLRNLPRSAAEVAGDETFGNRPVYVLSAAGLRPELLLPYENLARCSSNGHHIIASSAGHWVQLDDPDLVVETIVKAVEALRT
jgi:pimeloyl-ACP methyl ester carboxylesterase